MQFADAYYQRRIRQCSETVKADVDILQSQYRIGLFVKAIAGQLAGGQSFIRLY